MNHIKKVLEILNIELDKPFQIVGNYGEYKITENCNLYWRANEEVDWTTAIIVSINDLITGKAIVKTKTNFKLITESPETLASFIEELAVMCPCVNCNNCVFQKKFNGCSKIEILNFLGR